MAASLRAWDTVQPFVYSDLGDKCNRHSLPQAAQAISTLAAVRGDISHGLTPMPTDQTHAFRSVFIRGQ
jgi:hypothetical protein